MTKIEYSTYEAALQHLDDLHRGLVEHDSFIENCCQTVVFAYENQLTEEEI
ncbi:hypothetical protein QTN94_14320 [Vibrio sp. M250220]|uniref:hypothetical protein n=1 Tax=Vibrio sp. M250220 TaxID=3020894 RepID=UPI002F4207F3